ncbi:hypothetical protein DL767_009412 [Monosporascus sp. MG133]|nr:hypothetical protein DL767_009412 [Monosporascus sp. MG133]
MVGCQKYTDDQINFILDCHFRGTPHTQIKDEFLERFNFPSYNIKRVQYVVEHYGRNPKYGNRLINKIRNSKAPSTVSPPPREDKLPSLDEEKPAGGTDTPGRGPARPARSAQPVQRSSQPVQRSPQPVQRSPQPNTIVCLSCNGTGFVTVMPPFSLNEPEDDQTSRLVRDFLNYQPPRTTQPTDPYGVIDPALITHQPSAPDAAYITGNFSPAALHHGLAPLRSGVQGLQDSTDWDGMPYPSSSTGYYEVPSFDTATSYTGGPTAPGDPLALLNTRMPSLPELPATPYIQPPPLAPLKRRRDTSPSPSYSLAAAIDDTLLPTSAPGEPYGYHTPASDFHYGAVIGSSDFHYGTVGSRVPDPEIPTLAPGTPSSSQRRATKRPRVSASDERPWIPANKRPRIPASIPPSPSSAEASAAAAARTPRWTPAFPRATPVAGGEWTDTKREDLVGTVEPSSLPRPVVTGTGRQPHYDDQIVHSIEEDAEQAAPPPPRFYESNNQSPPPPAPGNDEAGQDAASGEGQWLFAGLSEPPGTPSRVLDEWRAQASPREQWT